MDRDNNLLTNEEKNENRIIIANDESTNQINVSQEKESVFFKIGNSIKEAIKDYPLALLLVVSTVCFTIAGAILCVKGGEKLMPTVEKPILSYVFTEGLAGDEEEDDYEESEDFEEDESSDMALNSENQSENVVVQESAPAVQETVTDTNGQVVTTPGEVVQPGEIESKPASDPANGVYLEVDKSYFDDALFIGDSRVEGLKLYSELDNATFYCKEGISITKLLKEKFVEIKIKDKKKKVTVAKALKEKQFAKIYLMVGINEVSYRDTKDFKTRYQAVIDKIRELQPNSKIIIMGMMKVTKSYSDGHPSFSNKNITKKNNAIAKLADNVNVFYLDFNPKICDSKGNVKSKYTWDGVHLKAEYYSIWVKFLMNHGI